MINLRMLKRMMKSNLKLFQLRNKARNRSKKNQLHNKKRKLNKRKLLKKFRSIRKSCDIYIIKNMMEDFLKPPKEYKFTILSNSIAKKKFVYRNKDKFPKYLRLDISNPNVIIMDYDQIEVPIEGNLAYEIIMIIIRRCCGSS